MHCYQNILYIATEYTDSGEGMKQAATLASQCGANLTIMAIYRDLPENLSQYRDSFEEELLKTTSDKYESVCKENNLKIDRNNVHFTTETGRPMFVRISQAVIEEKYDLLIKDVSPFDQKKGLRSLDMSLLRKCPCPVWLSRPYIDENVIRIVVAIDPETNDEIGNSLNLHLLKTGHDLAQRMNGELTVLSCWDFAHEDYLNHSVFIKISKEEIARMIEENRVEHFQALESTLKEAGLSQDDYHLEHLRGAPENIIPDFIGKNKIDLLIMGTVGRTGVPGFVMGNTAEDVIRQVECALLTIKPDNFDTPVKS